MTTITRKDLITWHRYVNAIKNKVQFEREDFSELIRLNHLVMEVSHQIHNDHMMSKNW